MTSIKRNSHYNTCTKPEMMENCSSEEDKSDENLIQDTQLKDSLTSYYTPKYKKRRNVRNVFYKKAETQVYSSKINSPSIDCPREIVGNRNLKGSESSSTPHNSIKIPTYNNKCREKTTKKNRRPSKSANCLKNAQVTLQTPSKITTTTNCKTVEIENLKKVENVKKKLTDSLSKFYKPQSNKRRPGSKYIMNQDMEESKKRDKEESELASQVTFMLNTTYEKVNAEKEARESQEAKVNADISEKGNEKNNENYLLKKNENDLSNIENDAEKQNHFNLNITGDDSVVTCKTESVIYLNRKKQTIMDQVSPITLKLSKGITLATLGDLFLYRMSQKKVEECSKDVMNGTVPQRLESVQLGTYEVKVNHYSDYPLEFVSLEKIFICHKCLSYFASIVLVSRHLAICEMNNPPGKIVYEKDLSIYRVDGTQQVKYCQNLCLLSKLFLKHKTLTSDVEPFYFYVLTKNGELLGYFSKEKNANQKYNLSCILTLPMHQKKGYGVFLIEFSYLLSRLHNNPATPERPFSKLGLITFEAYWRRRILTFFMNIKGQKSTSIECIMKSTGMTTEDVIETCQKLKILIMGTFDNSVGLGLMIWKTQLLKDAEYEMDNKWNNCPLPKIEHVLEEPFGVKEYVESASETSVINQELSNLAIQDVSINYNVELGNDNEESTVEMTASEYAYKNIGETRVEIIPICDTPVPVCTIDPVFCTSSDSGLYTIKQEHNQNEQFPKKNTENLTQTCNNITSYLHFTSPNLNYKSLSEPMYKIASTNNFPDIYNTNQKLENVNTDNEKCSVKNGPSQFMGVLDNVRNVPAHLQEDAMMNVNLGSLTNDNPNRESQVREGAFRSVSHLGVVSTNSERMSYMTAPKYATSVGPSAGEYDRAFSQTRNTMQQSQNQYMQEMMRSQRNQMFNSYMDPRMMQQQQTNFNYNQGYAPQGNYPSHHPSMSQNMAHKDPFAVFSQHGHFGQFGPFGGYPNSPSINNQQYGHVNRSDMARAPLERHPPGSDYYANVMSQYAAARGGSSNPRRTRTSRPNQPQNVNPNFYDQQNNPQNTQNSRQQNQMNPTGNDASDGYFSFPNYDPNWQRR